MKLLPFLFVFSAIVLTLPNVEAGTCGCKGNKNCPLSCSQQVCCGGMGGVQYCDSSAGRLVCNNGYYSSCYCTRHAIMDLQQVGGCCTWKGGVFAISPTGVVVCHDGSFSEICTLATPIERVAAW